MKAHYVREQKHICGKDYETAPYMEVDLFEVTTAQHKASRRAKRELATSLAMKKYNDGCAVRYFVQLANANFGRDDWALTLTYNDAHLPASGDNAQADRDFTNYARRVARYCKAHGLPAPKWLEVPEYCDIDESGKIAGRHHHHVIISGTVPRDVLEDLWRDRAGDKMGLTRCEHIDLDHGSFESLTRYMMKRKRHVRRWRQSRGLEKPKTPKPNDSRWSRKRLDDASTMCIDDREFWEEKYPGYTLNGCEVTVMGSGTKHIIVKMRNKKADRERGRPRRTAARGGAN